MSDRSRVLTTWVDPISPEATASRVATWALEPAGRVVCAANVHMVMEAWDDLSFADELSQADLVVCDGRPLVWYCRSVGVSRAPHARGLDVMLAVCAAAERDGLRVGLYGGSPDVLERVHRRLADGYPGLNVTYAWSPPFRELGTREDTEMIDALTEAGVQILFVALGCPKQERWMLAHRSRLPAVMLGVGAAFDFIAGATPSAPHWMQVVGFEWAFRLYHEPQRLWRRYAHHNGRFIALLLWQWLSIASEILDRAQQ